MGKRKDGDYAVIQECSEYQPIQATNNIILSYGEYVEEDAGCDSCIHLNENECQIYKRGSNY